MAKVAILTGSNRMTAQVICRRLARSGQTALGIDIGAEGTGGNWPHYRCEQRDSRAWRPRSPRSGATTG
jgi:hypothetical protein